MRLIFLGKPGSGKGTQTRRIVTTLKVPAISTGDLIRRAIAMGSEHGDIFRSHTEHGQLVPDHLVLDMVQQRLGEDDCHNGFVLDGFPRTLPQAVAYEAWANTHGQDIDAVIQIIVKHSELVKRAAGRRFCVACGHSFHTLFAPTKRPGICDACDSALEQRGDDRQEVVDERLRIYDEKTAPLIEFYSVRKLLFEVDGIGTPEEVFLRIDAVLQQL